MSFSSGNSSVALSDILDQVSEADIAYYYLGVTEIPCVIISPLRVDRHPSLSLTSTDGKRIFWKDFATKERGGLFDLLGRLWKFSYTEVLEKVLADIPNFAITASKVTASPKGCRIVATTEVDRESTLECRIREWQPHDFKYWNSYGISQQWLQFADVYPISHKIITKRNRRMVFGADKHAYAYVERKEGKVTLKIYQPFNQKGFKWSNKHDESVISLWTKLPTEGNIVCICASLKDALCLWANTGIPSIALQGEGYNMSSTAIEELKRRFKKVYILFDNDKEGIKDGIKLSESTGFINIVLPQFDGGKDVSDMYKSLQNKEEFKKQILTLFKTQTNDSTTTAST